MWAGEGGEDLVALFRCEPTPDDGVGFSFLKGALEEEFGLLVLVVQMENRVGCYVCIIEENISGGGCKRMFDKRDDNAG